MIKQVKIIENNKNKIIIKDKDNKVKIVKGDVFELNGEDKLKDYINDDLLVGGNGDETIV